MHKFGLTLVIFAGLIFLYQGVSVVRRSSGSVSSGGFSEAAEAPEKRPLLAPFWAGWMLVGGTLLLGARGKRLRDGEVPVEGSPERRH